MLSFGWRGCVFDHAFAVSVATPCDDESLHLFSDVVVPQVASFRTHLSSSKFVARPIPNIAQRVFQSQRPFLEKIDQPIATAIAMPQSGHASFIAVETKSKPQVAPVPNIFHTIPAILPTPLPVFAAIELSVLVASEVVF